MQLFSADATVLPTGPKPVRILFHKNGSLRDFYKMTLCAGILASIYWKNYYH